MLTTWRSLLRSSWLLVRLQISLCNPAFVLYSFWAQTASSWTFILFLFTPCPFSLLYIFVFPLGSFSFFFLFYTSVDEVGAQLDCFSKNQENRFTPTKWDLRWTKGAIHGCLFQIRSGTRHCWMRLIIDSGSCKKRFLHLSVRIYIAVSSIVVARSTAAQNSWRYLNGIEK